VNDEEIGLGLLGTRLVRGRRSPSWATGATPKDGLLRTSKAESVALKILRVRNPASEPIWNARPMSSKGSRSPNSWGALSRLLATGAHSDEVRKASLRSARQGSQGGWGSAGSSEEGRSG
jgi:hypothetical protein